MKWMKQEKEAFLMVPLYMFILTLIFPYAETLSWKSPVILLVDKLCLTFIFAFFGSADSHFTKLQI